MPVEALRYTDADLERAYLAGAFDDTNLGAFVEAGDCGCRSRAISHTRAFRRPEYGQVDHNFDGCADPDTFADGAVKVCCTNGQRVWEALADLGFSGEELDAELLRRLDAVAAGEEAVPPEYLAHVEDECRAVEAEAKRIAAELRASAILAEGGYPGDAIARAGRALRGEANP